MQIQAEELRSCVRDIFIAEGCSAAESERIAYYLVQSDLAGHESHGVARVPRYVDLLRAGDLVRDQELMVISESEGLTVVDGGYGFGPTVGPLAVQLGIENANARGVSIVALRHAGHLGRIGQWAEMAARAGLVSVHFVNVAGSVLVAPFGAAERRFSTAPFAAGFPLMGKDAIILDFATSYVAEGKVNVAARGGKPIPSDSLISLDGELSGDPQTLYGPIIGGDLPSSRNGTGAIRAFGEHKGSGLALFCELLAGVLTGSGCAGPGKRQFANGMLSIYMSPAYFGDMDQYVSEATAFLDFVKSARPVVPGDEVLLPGEPETLMRADRLQNGIPVPEDVWGSILELKAT